MIDSRTAVISAQTLKSVKQWWFDPWDRLVNFALSACGRPAINAGPGEIAIDPHVHTLFSHCSISSPDRVIRHSVNIGLGAVGIMDHDEADGAVAAVKCADQLKRRREIPESFLVIPGVEINSNAGHIGALFVTRQLPTCMSVEATVRMIHEEGGLAVAVHPYHTTGVGDAVFDAPFDAVEIECGALFSTNGIRRTWALATDPRLIDAAKIGSSDAHYVGAIGSCHSILKVSEPTVNSVREAIRNRAIKARSTEVCERVRRLLGRLRKLH
jgi:predicted metal-dependent phosphoesterase TrpH